MRFDLAEGFPLVTTKKLHIQSIIHELLWFLRGETNIALPEGKRRQHLGRMGRRAAASSGPSMAISGARGRRPTAARSTRSATSSSRFRTTPDSRRLIVSAWNVADIDRMALPPCHLLFQFYVAEGRLSCQMYQRSADVFLGVPFNIASYALLTLMVAQVTGPRARASSSTRSATPTSTTTIWSRPSCSSRASRGRCRRCGSTRR